MSKTTNEIEDMILKIFVEQFDSRSLTFTEIHDKIESEMRKAGILDFTIHDQQLDRILKRMIERVTLKKTETGYILPPKRSEEDLDLVKRNIESDNSSIFRLIQFGKDAESVNRQCLEYTMNLLERQKILTYRLLCDQKNEFKIREILVIIEDAIKGIHNLLKEREKKLSDRLQASINQSLSKEYYDQPYSCNPTSDFPLNPAPNFSSSPYCY